MQDEHTCTLCQELTSGHTHTEEYIAASKQWGMDGESSSAVIATSLNCTQSATSSHGWGIYCSERLMLSCSQSFNKLGMTGLKVVRQTLSSIRMFRCQVTLLRSLVLL